MQITRYSDGSLKLWFSDDDDYTLRENNDVDVWITKKDVERIRKAIS